MLSRILPNLSNLRSAHCSELHFLCLRLLGCCKVRSYRTSTNSSTLGIGPLLMQAGGTMLINISMAKAKARFGQLWQFWSSTSFPTTTKIRLFGAAVVSVLVYGSEAWLLDSCSDKASLCLIFYAIVLKHVPCCYIFIVFFTCLIIH